MATRQELQQRRDQLRQALLARCQKQAEGVLAVRPLPSARELARQHGLSVPLVGQVVRGLIEEGALYTVHGAGTFAGRRVREGFEAYLLVLPFEAEARSYLEHIRFGFEEQVARYGGVSVVLTEKEAHHRGASGDLPLLSGVFAINESGLAQWGQSGMPCVIFGRLEEEERGADKVHFDDVDGGRQATRHLLGHGHRRIAFLALHSEADMSAQLEWSREREQGWQEALSGAGHEARGLAFHPATPIDEANTLSKQVSAAREAALCLVRRSDITAVIAVNSFAAQGLFEALDEVGVPHEQWPAIVHFDDLPRSDFHIVSSLRLPWEEVGRVAASLLWERRNGRLSGPPQQRLVPMRMIARLSCRPDWARAHGMARRAQPAFGRQSEVMA